MKASKPTHTAIKNQQPVHLELVCIFLLTGAAHQTKERHDLVQLLARTPLLSPRAYSGHAYLGNDVVWGEVLCDHELRKVAYHF